jgi:hypothetical protein
MTVTMTNIIGRWRRQRSCWHHDHTTGQTWISGTLIDAGRAKLWHCTHCDRTWIT